MSIYLRILLIIVSLAALIYVIRKLKKSQLRLMDVLFWLFFSVGILVLGVFPSIAIFLADLIGIMSAANFVFLFIIFLLIIRVFLLNIRISGLESKVSNLVQEIAIREGKDDLLRDNNSKDSV